MINTLKICMVLLVIAVCGTDVAAQERTSGVADEKSIAWVTFDDASCQIVKFSGQAAPLVMSKVEGTGCTVKPVSEAFRNVGILVLEKNQPARALVLPGISNIPDTQAIPAPVVPNQKRTLLIMF